MQDINAIFHKQVKKKKYTVPMYIIFRFKKKRNKWHNRVLHLPKIITGYLQLKLSTNLVWNYCSIQFVLPWNVQFFWIKTALGESENKSIARIKKHTWKHSLKCTFCFHSTFSECSQYKVSTILWINQSY